MEIRSLAGLHGLAGILLGMIFGATEGEASQPFDVWGFRAAVAQIESLGNSQDSDHCYTEGDGEETQVELYWIRVHGQACEKRVKQTNARIEAARADFNFIWLPKLIAATQGGDVLAEVILRQCQTTEVLDRSHLESTCDSDAGRRQVAGQRLKEINFLPAVELGYEPNRGCYTRCDILRNQQLLLPIFRSGALALPYFSVSTNGNVVNSADDLAALRNWGLLQAVSQDAPRAFTIGDGSTWATSRFARLQINRQPLTPGFLTWGQHLHYGGGGSLYSGPQYWRQAGLNVFDRRTGQAAVISGSHDDAFLHEREMLLAEIEASIERYLGEDPRWGAFLLQRIGRHEWVPVGMNSETGHLAPTWLGRWRLVRQSEDWTKPLHPASGTATIDRSGDSFRIHIDAGSGAPLGDVHDCELRYSGGLTYLPEMVGSDQSPQQTLLGYFYAAGAPAPSGLFWRNGENREAVAPFDPAKRYRQVLMQCANAEMPDNVRVRFLLLAGDILVEFAAELPFGGLLAVRHFQRER